jgi:galactose-1-phosphate uridylyltransferase
MNREVFMFTLILDDETAKKLQAISARENRPLSEVVSAALAQYDVLPERPTNWALKMAQLAEADTSIEWNDSAIDLSDHSREILERE